jgi:cation diffusion facilitator CzcD-associated flavoprotein CzcO
MRESYHPLDADVIVVGAGISGMTTAFTLLKMEPSLNVMILEATGQYPHNTYVRIEFLARQNRRSNCLQTAVT